jgi:hypothetical protein
MAEIDIQKKSGPPAWIWIAVALGVLLLIGVIWAVTQNGDTRDREAMPADTVRDTAPATWDTDPAADDPWDTVPPAGDTWDTVPGAGDPGAFRGAGGEHLRLGFEAERIAA